MPDRRLTTSLLFSFPVLLGWYAISVVFDAGPPVGIVAIVDWLAGFVPAESWTAHQRSIMSLNLLGILAMPWVLHRLRNGRSGRDELLRWCLFGLLAAVFYGLGWHTVYPFAHGLIEAGLDQSHLFLPPGLDGSILLLPETAAPGIALESCFFAWLTIHFMRRRQAHTDLPVAAASS